MDLFGRGAAITLLLVAASTAEAQQARPDESLKLRQGLMQAARSQLAPLLAFAQGKADMPADANERATNLWALARLAPIGWATGTEALPHANTRPEAFGARHAEFQKGWTNLIATTARLSMAIGAGPDATRAYAVAVAKSCKSCHDEFRTE
jgi:cytochrome c556